MPRSLFFKIFIWFATVVVTVILGTFAIGELLRAEPHRHDRHSIEHLLRPVGPNAANTYERGGKQALLEYLNSVRRESDIRGFLFNRRIEELSGQRMPSQAPELAKRLFESRAAQLSSEDPFPIQARPVVSERGEEYVLVAEILPPMSRTYFYHPIFHILAVSLFGALSCYWLARHLTAPVTKLRAATQEFAAGNLGVRVPPDLGNRRDELASLGTDFNLMAEKIELLINSQRRLLGDISHELRSPLTRLNVALELARQRSGADAASALERIQHEADNLNEMIGELLALTRLESGAEVLPKVKFDLADVMRQVSDDADFEARSRNRSVTLKTADPVTILGTEHLLRRAIENVVRNAVQYTAEGTTVEVELQLQVGAPCTDTGSEEAGKDSTGRCAIITVRDHGPGVPEESLKEIFRPFYRVDYARDREAGGVGLGLAIAERAVSLHGGTVAAENAPGGGLLIVIRLPLDDGDGVRGPGQ